MADNPRWVSGSLTSILISTSEPRRAANEFPDSGDKIQRTERTANNPHSLSLSVERQASPRPRRARVTAPRADTLVSPTPRPVKVKTSAVAVTVVGIGFPDYPRQITFLRRCGGDVHGWWFAVADTCIRGARAHPSCSAHRLRARSLRRVPHLPSSSVAL